MRQLRRRLSFFDQVPLGLARTIAWIEMGSGAVLPGGGVTSYALGGLLLKQAGMSRRGIVVRSGGVFWLTSAVIALALALGAGLLLTRTGGGPHDLARALLPLIIATPLTLLIAVSPKLVGHRPQQGTRSRWWGALIDGVPQLIVLPALNPERRAGLQAILATEPVLQVVGSAAGEHALWQLLERTPQQSSCSISTTPDATDWRCASRSSANPDPPAVVLYSAYTPAALVVAAAVAGADAIVSKSSTLTTLLEAVRTVARNPRTVPPISPQMKADAAARVDPADHAILAMRVAGDSPVEIATTLGVPDATIANRIAAIVAKLERLRSAA